MDKREEILIAAEKRARIGGYFGFSFRDIASDVGIKSASVHYYFPTKEDIVGALSDRYLEQTKQVLGDPAACSGDEGLRNVIDLFLSSNEGDDLMCLCGIFGAEMGSLPSDIAPKVAKYFDFLTRWLCQATKGLKSEQALLAVAALEGGMIIARTKNDPDILRTVAEQVLRNL